jgi:hypothetical protein
MIMYGSDQLPIDSVMTFNGFISGDGALTITSLTATSIEGTFEGVTWLPLNPSITINNGYFCISNE